MLNDLVLRDSLSLRQESPHCASIRLPFSLRSELTVTTSLTCLKALQEFDHGSMGRPARGRLK